MLNAYFHSDDYRQSEFLPISSLRAESYLANPNAKPEDNVMYIGYCNSKLVAFRTVFPDLLYSGANRFKFVWLSGNWVHPAFRRAGFSTILYNAIKEDWEYIANTNHSPASKKVYDKTGDFEELAVLTGQRFYLRFDLAGLLSQKHHFFEKISAPLRWTDTLLNVMHDFRIKWLKKETIKNRYISLDAISSDVWAFIEKHISSSLFRKDHDIWNWILNHSWVSSSSEYGNIQKKYPFSVYSPDFVTKPFLCRNKNGEISSFCWITIKGGNMKIPYLFCEQDTLQITAAFVMDMAVKQKVNTITVFHPGLISALSKYSRFFLYRKQQTHKFIINLHLSSKLHDKSGILISPGDGDGVFT